MATESEIKKKARDFVQSALTEAQGKRPSQRAMNQAIKRIVENFAPLADRRESTSAKKASARG